MPQALSFTSLKQWEASREMFFIDRLSDRRPVKPRLQGKPAAVGSAFDVLVKFDLANDRFGRTRHGGDVEKVFNSQVELEHRAWALEAGLTVLKAYRTSGAYHDLLILLERSSDVPRFEFDVSGTVGGVPFFGRPDCAFEICGVPVTLDWKVRGYCSSASPTAGYLICCDGFDGKHSRSHAKSHKLFAPSTYCSIPLNAAYLDAMSEDYAAQLSIYSWLAGAEPGDEDFVAQIEEFVGAPPAIRVATHRARISQEFQLGLLKKAQDCWRAITSGHIFQDLSRDESDARCRMLESPPRPQADQVAVIEETYSLAA